MENTKIQHWKKNEFTWRKSRQLEENRTLKQRFKQVMGEIKAGLSFDYEAEDLEDVD
jgi:hypothetical protein